ncbi:MAG: Sec-independent protein translocase protein TatB [Halochromatium sp.]
MSGNHREGETAQSLRSRAEQMFDIGALELLVVGVVALIVVGPERLPRLARTAGLWIGRARRAFSAVKEEIEREIKADELKEILRKQANSNPLETILEEGRDSRSTATPSASSRAEGPKDGS